MKSEPSILAAIWGRYGIALKSAAPSLALAVPICLGATFVSAIALNYEGSGFEEAPREEIRRRLSGWEGLRELRQPQAEPAPAATVWKRRPKPEKGRGCASSTEASPFCAERPSPLLAAASPVPQPAPGVVLPDPDAAELALERSLVRAGALLVPAGQVEIGPTLTYRYDEGRTPQLFTGAGGAPVAGETNGRRHELGAALGMRVGLPGEAELRLDLPYEHVQQSSVDRVGGTSGRERDVGGGALGDLRLALAKTLLREQDALPDLIGEVSWDTATGQEGGRRLPTGNGQHEVGVRLTALKRQDPLVFTASLGHEWALDQGDLDPGNRTTASFGTYLAASPASALRAELQYSYADDVSVGGRTLEGTDRTQASLVLGASTRLGPASLLDVSLGVGLTDDTPDLTFTVSIPVRLDFDRILGGAF